MSPSPLPPQAPVGVMSITPFAPDGSVDEGLLRAHLARFLPHPLSVYVCSQGSGEGLSLSREEKMLVYRTAVDVLGGRRQVVGAGVGLTGSTDAALADVAALSATGVDAVQVFPPRPGALRPRDRELVAYYDEVFATATCPVIVGENVTLVGYEIGLRVLRTIFERHPEVAGLSWTVPAGGVAALTALGQEFGTRIPIRTGLIHHWANAAAVGAGILCFDGNTTPGLLAAAWEETTTSGVGPQGSFHRLLTVNALLSRYGNPASIKAAHEHLGLPAGALRRPFLGLDDAQRAELGEGLDRLALKAGEL